MNKKTFKAAQHWLDTTYDYEHISIMALHLGDNLKRLKSKMTETIHELLQSGDELERRYELFPELMVGTLLKPRRTDELVSTLDAVRMDRHWSQVMKPIASELFLITLSGQAVERSKGQTHTSEIRVHMRAKETRCAIPRLNGPGKKNIILLFG